MDFSSLNMDSKHKYPHYQLTDHKLMPILNESFLELALLPLWLNPTHLTARFTRIFQTHITCKVKDLWNHQITTEEFYAFKVSPSWAEDIAVEH